MGVEFAAERRLLTEGEYAPIVSSHYPSVGALPHAELVELAGWLRSQRDRARDIVTQRRRARRGKADGRGIASQDSSERGLAAKKQVFARALKRVNARLDHMRAEQKREAAVAALRDALARRQGLEPHHPTGGGTEGAGMRPKASRRRRTNVPPGRIGSVSQMGKAFQAGRDSRGP